jgi:hypothetical protein
MLLKSHPPRAGPAHWNSLFFDELQKLVQETLAILESTR